MNFTVLTIFPELFDRFWENGIIGRALKNEIISYHTVDIRNFSTDKHKKVDEKPYGGGSGMLFKPEPLFIAIEHAKKVSPEAKTVLLSPQGRVFSQNIAKEYALYKKGYVLVCGRYEGVDERTYSFFDDEISIGDFIISGGELAAMLVIDSVARLIPGSLGGEDSAEKESFENQLIEHAHYTRPENFAGERVPQVLLSGNHKKIEEWRLESSLKRTFLKRPDMFKNRKFSEEEIEILRKWRDELGEIIYA